MYLTSLGEFQRTEIIISYEVSTLRWLGHGALKICFLYCFLFFTSFLLLLTTPKMEDSPNQFSITGAITFLWPCNQKSSTFLSSHNNSKTLLSPPPFKIPRRLERKNSSPILVATFPNPWGGCSHNTEKKKKKKRQSESLLTQIVVAREKKEKCYKRNRKGSRKIVYGSGQLPYIRM